MKSAQLWRGASVVVTGAGGFLGGHLREALTSAGVRGVLVDARRNPLFRDEGPQWTVRQMPRQVAAMAELVSDASPDVIFHCGGQSQLPVSLASPIRDATRNTVSTLVLLEALRRLAFRGVLVFTSSSAVYGEALELPITEEHPTLPLSPYGVSKLAAERYVSVYAAAFGLRTLSARLFSVYGPGQRKQVVFDLIRKMERGGHVRVEGSGSELRDFLYVTDAVEALLLLGGSARADGAAYNLCSGHGTSVRDLAMTLAGVCGVVSHIEFTQIHARATPTNSVGSPTRLAALGFVPQVDLLDGLTRTVAWCRGTGAPEGLVQLVARP